MRQKLVVGDQMASENGIIAWVNSLRESTEKRFFLGHIKESATTDAEYDKPGAFRVCLIGRAHQSDIHLADCYCSRYHALVYFSEGTPMIRDLDSRTGTTVNNIMLVGGRDYPLAHGDIISVVGERFAFIYEEEEPKKHSVDRNLPVVSMATHTCPYCQRFIPEFSTELEVIQNRAYQILNELTTMEASYKSFRSVTEKIFEKVELVKHHHDAYHHELLVEARERRMQELEATRVADTSVVMARSRIVMDDNEQNTENSDENVSVEPELKKRESLKVDDLTMSKTIGKSKKRVAFMQKSQHIDETEKKSNIFNSIISSIAFWKKSIPSVDSSVGQQLSGEETSSGESGEEEREEESGEEESGEEREREEPKSRGKDTPAPPRYEFDDESDN